ncbi:hypothetical protein LCGC14_2919730 [marine sediment metagenome]|uniref:DUF7736 domain-containing protein n=1 Tax=marine sediment metagenome TaxID=412755 RepID=A0A0F9AF83_9ZZZZ
MRQLTKDEAIDFAKDEFWRTLTDEQIAHFQINQDKLCVPFERFHKAITECLGRPVWTHEFADRDKLRDELNGKIPAPSFDEILEGLPMDKTIIVTL